MSFDITKRRALETADIDLVNGDGSPLLDDDGNQLSVTVYGPGSKVWMQADAEKARKRTARIQKDRRIGAALEGANDDEVEFLASITLRFNGWEYPHPDGKKWGPDRDMFRAAYGDDTLGFIRDHVHREASDWSAFTKGSPKG